MGFHVAQLNIALPREPLEAPLLADFVAALEPVNAAADVAPGFVWRLRDDDGGDATTIRAFGDDRLIVNMSVWESLDALRAFVYTAPMHRGVLRERRRWFEGLGEAHLVLWWVPAGHEPSVEEAEERLARLRAQGPTAGAFTFRQHFPPPDAGGVDEVRDLCPAG